MQRSFTRNSVKLFHLSGFNLRQLLPQVGRGVAMGLQSTLTTNCWRGPAWDFLGGNPRRFFCEMSVILKQLVVSSSFTCSNFFLNELILEFRGVTAPDTTHLQLVSLNFRKLSFWWFRKFPPTIGRQCFFVVVPLFQHDTWICFFRWFFYGFYHGTPWKITIWENIFDFFRTPNKLI